MVHQLRIALIVFFLGASAVIGWNLLDAQDRIYQSNVPGIDPANPLAQYGIESEEHHAYVDAKLRNVRWRALEVETGLATICVVLWIVLPIFSGRWVKQHADEL
jgi:hypothetical protein